MKSAWGRQSWANAQQISWPRPKTERKMRKMKVRAREWFQDKALFRKLMEARNNL